MGKNLKVFKKISVGAFLKKGVDIKDGDILEIANEGKEVSGTYGIQNIFLVKTKDGKEGNVSFNQTTMNGLIDTYGDDTIKWIGKSIKAWKVKMSVAGKFQDVWFFSHPDAEQTKDGFILSGNQKTDDISTDDIPVIDEENIDVKQIPF